MFRKLPLPDEALTKMLRNIIDRIERLERRPSTDNGVLALGDVTMTVVPGVGDARTVVFTNTLTGTTSTIPLA